MSFLKSWIFWLLYAILPFAITYLFELSRTTMVLLYFGACLVAIAIWGIIDKLTPKAEKDF